MFLDRRGQIIWLIIVSCDQMGCDARVLGHMILLNAQGNMQRFSSGNGSVV